MLKAQRVLQEAYGEWLRELPHLSTPADLQSADSTVKPLMDIARLVGIELLQSEHVRCRRPVLHDRLEATMLSFNAISSVLLNPPDTVKGVVVSFKEAYDMEEHLISHLFGEVDNESSSSLLESCLHDYTASISDFVSGQAESLRKFLKHSHYEAALGFLPCINDFPLVPCLHRCLIDLVGSVGSVFAFLEADVRESARNPFPIKNHLLTDSKPLSGGTFGVEALAGRLAGQLLVHQPALSQGLLSKSSSQFLDKRFLYDNANVCDLTVDAVEVARVSSRCPDASAAMLARFHPAKPTLPQYTGTHMLNMLFFTSDLIVLD